MRLLFSIALFLSASAFGIAADAVLTGSVTTIDGKPVPQLTVEIRSVSGAFLAVTGPSGQYRFDSLPEGEYTASVDAPGLELIGPATVAVGTPATRLDLKLAPAPVREHVLVSATRSEARLSTAGASATVIDSERIVERQASSLLPLLQEVPGLTVARTGSIGHQASAFLRGGESFHARVLVDGVPINEPGGAYNFASQLALDLDQVEVVRGAVSSLYGTDALAGVIQLQTRRAEPGAAPELRVEAEGGNVAWRRLHAGSSGTSGPLDWSFGVARLHTEHEPNGLFEETAIAASVGARLSEASRLRFVVRGEDSHAGVAGPYAYGRPDLEEYSDHRELVFGTRLDHAGRRFSHQARLGYARTDQLSADLVDSGPYLPRQGALTAAFESFDFLNPGFLNHTRRLSLGYQVQAQAGGGHLVTAGAEIERESGEIGFEGDLLSPVRTNEGFYLQDQIVLGNRLFLTLGGRVEHNQSFGTAAVPRGAVAWRLRGEEWATTLKAGAGAGIKEPSFLQSFGTQDFARGNPDLQPERSRTFDFGVEQRLAGDRLRFESTFFHHEYRDQIAYKILSFSPFFATYENLGKTRARGLELAMEAAPTSRTRLLGQYTFTDGEILISNSASPLYAPGEPLLRRPRHLASLSGWTGFGPVQVGATWVYVGRRLDSDFLGIGLTESEPYSRVDLRGRIALRGGLEVFLASENLFDRQYQEVLGYPALGRTLRAGVRFRTALARP
jgi:vitamin B12 transporter